MAENVDNALTVEILREIRKELRDHRALLLQLADDNRRSERLMGSRFGAVDKSFAALESRFAAVDQSLAAINARISTVDQRVGDLTSDLELMVKSELMGALTNFQNKIEIYVDQRLAEKAE